MILNIAGSTPDSHTQDGRWGPGAQAQMVAAQPVGKCGPKIFLHPRSDSFHGSLSSTQEHPQTVPVPSPAQPPKPLSKAGIPGTDWELGGGELAWG